MKYLLDTHVFLWAITDDPRLPAKYRDLWQDPHSELFLSTASLWEMAIKAALGKLPAPRPTIPYMLRQMDRNRVQYLPIHTHHVTELETLPAVHRDPFDRMIVAQSRAERCPVLTTDPAILDYGVAVPAAG